MTEPSFTPGFRATPTVQLAATTPEQPFPLETPGLVCRYVW
ncbi:MAG TPA: hypothetical protein VFR47_33755 [Anaerolineales bacterium]|nr:hypothetical protein [Anaerolineales bacterium]